MSAPQKRTATEALQALEAMEEDDEAEREADRILALSPEALDRELATAGVDPAAARARGEEIALKAAQLSAAPPARPRRLSRPFVALAIAAAFAAILLGAWGGAGGAIARWVHPPPRDVRPEPPDTEQLAREHALTRARDLRGAAHVACADGFWVNCLRDLDEARALDPAGDADPSAQADRRKATSVLAPPPKEKPGPK